MGFVIIENVYSAFSIFVSYVTAYKSEILLSFTWLIFRLYSWYFIFSRIKCS